VTGRLVAALLMSVTSIAGCGGEAGSPSTGPQTEATETSTTSAEASGRGRCDFPALRPAYLPWQMAGEPVPAPSKERFAGYAHLFWSDGEASYVALWRVRQVFEGPGEPAPSLPNGAEGYLYEGSSDEDIAQWHIVWADVQADGCNKTTLVLNSPRLTKQEGKRAILQLAATLREET
jgi:hypothetical protein